MQLHEPAAAPGIVKRAIAPAGQTVFAPPGISKILNNRAACIEGIQPANDRNQIQNRLGTNAGDRGRADMVDRKNGIACSGHQPVTFPPCLISPGGVVLYQVYDDRSWHIYKSTSVTLPGSIGSPRKISPRWAKRPGASVARKRAVRPAPSFSSDFSCRIFSTAAAVVSALSISTRPVPATLAMVCFSTGKWVQPSTSPRGRG